ncbi:MAG: threonine/serine exporter family protein [Firmicutes bacterium]|nr:threonine/serine exporter family protein [Bacillota bacterium]
MRNKNSDLLSGLLNMAEGMLVTGSEVSRVEDTIARMGRAYGAKHMNVFVITSCIIVTMEMADGEEMTQTRRINRPIGTDFEKLERFNELSRCCCAGEIPAEQLEDKVREIEHTRPRRLITWSGSLLAAGGFAVFFGGSLIDGIVAALFAILIWWLQEKLLPISMNQLSFNLICSAIIGILTGICTGFLPVLHLDKILIGYIMLLIPGITLTNAVRNVLVGNTISGLMRLVEALLWAAGLALGFMIAMFVIDIPYDLVNAISPTIPVQLITAGIGSLGFSLMFNVRKQLLPEAVLGGILDWGVYLLASEFFGGNVFLSSVAAAAFATIYAETMARIKKAPATVFYIPTVVPLIPGGSLFYTMSYAVLSEWNMVQSYGASTLYCALGIAAGMSMVLSIAHTARRIELFHK